MCKLFAPFSEGIFLYVFAYKQAPFLEILGINLKVCLHKVNKYELVQTLHVLIVFLWLPNSKNMNFCINLNYLRHMFVIMVIFGCL